MDLGYFDIFILYNIIGMGYHGNNKFIKNII